MIEQSLSALLEILSSSSVGMDALTSQVAIFGVLQNAHACATTGDELGFEYVRMFIARLAQQTSDQAKVAQVTEVLHKKLQDQVLRAFAQAQALSKLLPSKIPQPDGKIANGKQSKASAQQPAVEKSIHTPNVSIKPPSDLKAIQPAPYKDVHMKASPALKMVAKASGIPSSDPRQPNAIKLEESVRDTSMARIDRVIVSRISPNDTAEKPIVPHVRPHHHVYPCTSSDGRAEKNAAISADIRNYSESGEDLDWTKISDPAERKRLQGIIGGRKYRERQLAAQGKGGSGGNYPGAAGEGSTLSAGYGPQRPYGYSKTKSKSPQPPLTNVTPVKSRDHSTSAPSTLLHKALGIRPGSSASPMADSNVPRHSFSATASGSEPVIYHGLEEQTGDYWNHGRLTNSIEHVGSAKATVSSTLVGPDDGQEAQGEGSGQGGFEDFFQSLVDSVTPQESRSRHEGNSTGFTDDDQQHSLTPHSPALIYDPHDDYEGLEDERPTWEPNAGDVACFQLDKPLKTAFNMFVRSAHDAHRFPAKTRKNVVETYHLFIRQVWNLLLEQDKIAWRSLAAARGCFSATELSVKGQHILESQGILSKFLPHVEPSFEGVSSIPAAGA
jgi:hypothetical protein